MENLARKNTMTLPTFSEVLASRAKFTDARITFETCDEAGDLTFRLGERSGYSLEEEEYDAAREAHRLLCANIAMARSNRNNATYDGSRHG